MDRNRLIRDITPAAQPPARRRPPDGVRRRRRTVPHHPPRPAPARPARPAPHLHHRPARRPRLRLRRPRPQPTQHPARPRRPRPVPALPAARLAILAVDPRPGRRGHRRGLTRRAAAAPVRRARRHRPARHVPDADHLLAVNGFFVALYPRTPAPTTGRGSPGGGTRPVAATRAATSSARTVTACGSRPGRAVPFWLEMDLGTEVLSRVAGKLHRLRRRSARAAAYPVLFWLPGTVREANLHAQLARDGVPDGVTVATAADDHAAGARRPGRAGVARRRAPGPGRAGRPSPCPRWTVSRGTGSRRGRSPGSSARRAASARRPVGWSRPSSAGDSGSRARVPRRR